MPAMRRWQMAWLDTSTTACEQPLAAIERSQLASSQAGGVVHRARADLVESQYPSVPSKPARSPAASKMLAIKCVVVVLPFVPVTSTTRNDFDGSPASAWQ